MLMTTYDAKRINIIQELERSLNFIVEMLWNLKWPRRTWLTCAERHALEARRCVYKQY